jgi:hypothetical protein
MLLTSLHWPLSHLELQVQLPWPHAILWICRCSHSPHAQCGFWKVCYPASIKSITPPAPCPSQEFFSAVTTRRACESPTFAPRLFLRAPPAAKIRCQKCLLHEPVSNRTALMTGDGAGDHHRLCALANAARAAGEASAAVRIKNYQRAIQVCQMFTLAMCLSDSRNTSRRPRAHDQ